MKVLWLTLAYLSCVVAFAWLALAMEPHWQQVRGALRPTRGSVRLLRGLGSSALLGALWLCLRADHASMAALVWVMTLTAAALTVALTLSWRPGLLAPSVAWVRGNADPLAAATETAA